MLEDLALMCDIVIAADGATFEDNAHFHNGGIAPGIERLMMVLVPTDNIRDVMAFPKTASAADLMIDAPGEVDAKQLEELHLRVVKDE